MSYISFCFSSFPHFYRSKVLFLALSVTFLFFLFAYEISREPLNGFAPNLQGRRVCSLARTTLNVTVKGQRSRSPRTKKRKTAESSPLIMHSKACAVGRTQKLAADDSIAWPPGVTEWRQCTLTAACVRFTFGKTSLALVFVCV